MEKTSLRALMKRIQIGDTIFLDGGEFTLTDLNFRKVTVNGQVKIKHAFEDPFGGHHEFDFSQLLGTELFVGKEMVEEYNWRKGYHLLTSNKEISLKNFAVRNEVYDVSELFEDAPILPCGETLHDRYVCQNHDTIFDKLTENTRKLSYREIRGLLKEDIWYKHQTKLEEWKPYKDGYVSNFGNTDTPTRLNNGREIFKGKYLNKLVWELFAEGPKCSLGFREGKSCHIDNLYPKSKGAWKIGDIWRTKNRDYTYDPELKHKRRPSRSDRLYEMIKIEGYKERLEELRRILG